jgi:hypothetical protein
VVDAPAVSGVPASVPDLTPSNAVDLAPGLAVSDFSSTMLSSATVTITAGTFTGDLLSAVTNNTAITASYDSTAATLALAGYDSLTNYQQVLRTIAFSSTNSNPTQNDTDVQRTITWSVSDGLLSSTPVQTILNIGSGATNQLNRISITSSANGWTLGYLGIAGQEYVVQSAVSLPGPWSDISGTQTADVNGAITYLDSTPSAPTRFYRVRTGP